MMHVCDKLCNVITDKCLSPVNIFYEKLVTENTVFQLFNGRRQREDKRHGVIDGVTRIPIIC